MLVLFGTPTYCLVILQNMILHDFYVRIKEFKHQIYTMSHEYFVKEKYGVLNNMFYIYCTIIGYKPNNDAKVGFFVQK